MARDFETSLGVQYRHDGFRAEVGGAQSEIGLRLVHTVVALPLGIATSFGAVTACLGANIALPWLTFAAGAGIVCALVYLYNRPTVKTTVAVGELGITVTTGRSSQVLLASDCVHAESRNDHIILTTRSCGQLEIAADSHTEAERAWLVSQLVGRIQSWNAPTGKVPDAIRGLRGTQTPA